MKTKKKKIHFENLDGLRFLCFLSVFFFHSFHTNYFNIAINPVYQFIKRNIFGNGNLGVNFFFVLSGFLITYLLIEEKKLRGNIDVRNFWIRRILRIWPLFYFCVFFGFVIFPCLKTLFGDVPNETANPWMYVFLLSNFDLIKSGQPDSSVLGVLWSVAIEEQFYLTWPVILYLFPIKKYWVPFSIIIASNLIFRIYNPRDVLYEHHTLSCIGDMTVGAIGAWLCATSDKFIKTIENLKKPYILLIYVGFIFVYFFRDEVLFSNYYIKIFERLFIAIIFLSIILEQNFSRHSFYKMSNFKIISQLGVITYGLYCLHFIGILTAITLTNKLMINTALWQVLIIDTSIAFILTIGISFFSYRFYEKPFLKLKDKFSYITK